MVGTWRWNVVFGIFGAILTIVFSIGSNPITVALIRSLYAFAAFFALAYAARAIFSFLILTPTASESAAVSSERTEAQLDVVTPDETDEINQLLKNQLQNDNPQEASKAAENEPVNDAFRPLHPPQLVSTKNKQPEELAQAIRHMTGE